MTKNARSHAALTLLLLIGALCPGAMAQERGESVGRFDFYTRGPYREQVPRPQSLLRYDVGEFHTNYALMERVIAAAASDRVRVFDIGLTNEYRNEQESLPVLVDSAYFFRPSKEGTNAVIFPADSARSLHIAGFIWPTTESLLRGTSYVIDEPTGRGHVVLFAEDPNFRAIWRSTTRLFFNSFLFQPIF